MWRVAYVGIREIRKLPVPGSNKEMCAWPCFSQPEIKWNITMLSLKIIPLPFLYSSPLSDYITSSAMGATKSKQKKQKSQVKMCPFCCYMFGLTHSQRKILYLWNTSKRKQRCLPAEIPSMTIPVIHIRNTCAKFVR